MPQEVNRMDYAKNMINTGLIAGNISVAITLFLSIKQDNFLIFLSTCAAIFLLVSTILGTVWYFDLAQISIWEELNNNLAIRLQFYGIIILLGLILIILTIRKVTP